MGYRDALPQLANRLFLTDGGIETTLIFLEGLELPDFAAFHLLQSREGTAALRKYFTTYAELANQYGLGLILESATWRANSDWGKRLGYSRESLAQANAKAIDLLEEIRLHYQADQPVVISGCVGPRGDGYVVDSAMSASEAEAYHAEQIGTFASTTVDLVTAITMTYAEEAIGVVRAAQQRKLPVVISFTVETNGCLPSGQPLGEAIQTVDQATDGAAAYFMINCAHPSHFESVLESEADWTRRIRGLRANASSKSHAELDEATELDSGDPKLLAADYARLKQLLPNLTVMGGCCGTDHRHIEQIAQACSPLFVIR